MTADAPQGDDEAAPGWAAIERHIWRHVTPCTPLHWGTSALPDQGVYAISAYDLGYAWLLVTLGLSELFSKVSANQEVSGFGFELTMLVPHDGGASEPAPWARNLLFKLGQYVYSSGELFGPGHRMGVGGPITGMPGTALTGVVFAEDPALGTLGSPFGALTFLRVVGVTAGELEQMRRTSTQAVIAQGGRWGAVLLTDPGRA